MTILSFPLPHPSSYNPMNYPLPHSLYCKENSNTANEKGVNWLPINALLACKRCPFEVQVTPF